MGKIRCSGLCMGPLYPGSCRGHTYWSERVATLQERVYEYRTTFFVILYSSKPFIAKFHTRTTIYCGRRCCILVKRMEKSLELLWVTT